VVLIRASATRNRHLTTKRTKCDSASSEVLFRSACSCDVPHRIIIDHTIHKNQNAHHYGDNRRASKNTSPWHGTVVPVLQGSTKLVSSKTVEWASLNVRPVKPQRRGT